MTTEPILELHDIYKRFGPVHALSGVDLDVHRGEVHALIGENGAGKSTLVKVLAGALQADAGSMRMSGVEYAPRGPRDGREAGISVIYQELTLAPHLSVEANVLLGLEEQRHGWIKPAKLKVREALLRLRQTDIHPDDLVSDLSIGKQQVVEIARALVADARVVVMDEPTSSLSSSDAQSLFEVIRLLRAEGIAVIYISHFLEEVLEVCDRYTVLRDGKTVSSGLLGSLSIDDLIPPMIGRSVNELYPPRVGEFGEVLLDVQELNGFDGIPREASFSVRRGEILGIGGLVGAGRSEALRTLFGLRPAAGGRATIASNESGAGRKLLTVADLTAHDALEYGMNLLSEDRKEEGLAIGLSIRENLTLSRLKRYVTRGRLRLKKERKSAAHWVDRLGIRSHSVDQPASTLSGGNQQKLCLARLLHDDSDILLLDEPTRGVDIGSKAEIYRLISEVAARGKAVVMTSSYLPELFGICDTIVVMHRGKLSPARPASEWSEEEVLRYATTGY